MVFIKFVIGRTKIAVAQSKITRGDECKLLLMVIIFSMELSNR